MDVHRLYKLAKHCLFNYHDLIDKFLTGKNPRHQLMRLARAYPHTRYSIQDFFKQDPDIPMWVGNKEATERLLTAMIQGRLVILTGPPGSGKTYYIDHKITKRFDVVRVPYSSESMERLEIDGQIGSLRNKRRVFVIDSIDKITAKHIKRLSRVAKKVKCGVIVVTNKKKLAKTPPHIEVITFQTLDPGDRLVALLRYFPLKSEKELKTALPMEHLGLAIRFLETGVKPKKQPENVTTFYYLVTMLFSKDADAKRDLYDLMMKMNPNPATLLIYLADQAQLTHANREIVTKILQRHTYNIRPSILYAELAFGLIPQDRFHFDKPDTTTRRKWAKKGRKKKKKKAAPKIKKARRSGGKTKKKQPQRLSGGLGRFRGRKTK